METIPIFFSIDNNYAPWLAVAINSLVDNASKDYKYHIIVLHQGLSQEHIRKISQLSKPGFEIQFKEMQSQFEGISPDQRGNKLRCDYFTLTIYFRLFIPDMFPQYEKGIYIDSDICVPGDISELYRTELGDNLLAACTDFSIQEIPPFIRYVQEAVGVEGRRYINSGILLMNLKELRIRKMGARFLEILNRWHPDTIAPDQDYINALCKDQIVYLDEKWDAMPAEGKPELEHPSIIHYNLFNKPWCYDNVPYESYFWKYAETSGYLETIKAYKAGYSDEQKKSDSESGGRMIHEALRIIEDEVTFKKLFESGKEARL